MNSITGDLSADLPNGETVTDSTDLGLAWKAAESLAGDKWKTMSYAEKNADVTEILAAFREAYDGS